MTLWEKIKESMLSNPTSTVSEKEAKMTYEEMVIFAEKFAKGLTSSCYGILCNSELSCAMALLSCFAAGATAVPLSIRYGEKHCRKIIDKIGMPYIISDIYGELQTTDIDMGRYRKPLIKPALIMCTSGTSGNPKGVMLGEKNILTNVGDIAEYFDVTEEDTVLIARPLYHCAVLT
ncbi:MAG: class I adenylate-forming enzyme family protein, partial [Clostridia bacterium]|nr:class I adenylate-forming enzyme family protein [Clostridia bacterium]